MENSTTKKILWDNVLALMRKHYGKENLTRLATDASIGPGTATRIKAQETSVGVDVLEKIGGVFGVEPWQLIAPALGSINPKSPDYSPFASVLARSFDVMKADEQEKMRVFNYCSLLIDRNPIMQAALGLSEKRP